MNFEAQVRLYDNEIKELKELIHFSIYFGMNDPGAIAELKKKMAVVMLKRRRLFKEKIMMVDYLDMKKK